VAASQKSVRDNLPVAESKLLYGRSRGQCAFPGCGAELVLEADGKAVNVGLAAHIVAASRQGPRGREPVDEIERDKRASNRILLCHTHHTLVDSLPHIYTVALLRQMKLEHEGVDQETIRPAASNQRETLLSSLLPVTGLPHTVYSATLLNAETSESDAAKSADYSQVGRDVVFPFLIREHRLLTFGDLRKSNSPFKALVDTDVESIAVSEMVFEAEGHRRVVALLNRSMSKHLGRYRMRFDREHNRYYFTADRDRDSGELQNRSLRYRTKTNRNQKRDVVHQVQRRSDGLLKDEWWHDAVQLRFETSRSGWFLSVRPEFHLTSDGDKPLPSNRIGRRVTRKKSRVYNDIYLNLLWFWKEFLTEGNPRLVIKVGEQSILIGGAYVETHVEWPGIPNDRIDVSAAPAQENLFSLLDLSDETDFDDESWWDDDDDEGDE
jgi:hypothetical protein